MDLLYSFVEEQLRELPSNDGEHSALVPYIIALLKKEHSTREEHISSCTDELKEFLKDEGSSVVARIFAFLDEHPEERKKLQGDDGTTLETMDAEEALATEEPQKRQRSSEEPTDRKDEHIRDDDGGGEAKEPSPKKQAFEDPTSDKPAKRERFQPTDSDSEEAQMRPDDSAAASHPPTTEAPTHDGSLLAALETAKKNFMGGLPGGLASAPAMLQRMPTPLQQTPPPGLGLSSLTSSPGGGVPSLAALASLLSTPASAPTSLESQLRQLQQQQQQQQPPPLSSRLPAQPLATPTGTPPLADLSSALSSLSQAGLDLSKLLNIPTPAPAPARPPPQGQLGQKASDMIAHLNRLQQSEKAKQKDLQVQRMQSILVVCRVPASLNNETTIKKFFEKFGPVNVVLCNPHTSKAYVVFASPVDCLEARTSPGAILGNRFIAVYPCGPHDLEEILRIPPPKPTPKSTSKPKPAAAVPPERKEEEKKLQALREQLQAKQRQAEQKIFSDLQAKQEQIEACQQEVEKLRTSLQSPELPEDAKAELSKSLEEANEIMATLAAEEIKLKAKMEKYRDDLQKTQRADSTSSASAGKGQKPWWQQRGEHTMDLRPRVIRFQGHSQSYPSEGELKKEVQRFGEARVKEFSEESAVVEFATRWQAEKCQAALQAQHPSMSVVL